MNNVKLIIIRGTILVKISIILQYKEKRLLN